MTRPGAIFNLDLRITCQSNPKVPPHRISFKFCKASENPSNPRSRACLAIEMRLAAILALLGASCAVALFEDTGASVAKMGHCLRECGDDLNCKAYCLTVSN
jgi:hypothetical protein